MRTPADRRQRRLRPAVPLLAGLAVAVLPAGAAAGGGDLGGLAFRTPSGNIHCLYERSGAQAELRCDIGSGLRPPPRAACAFDWAALRLPARGRALPGCVSDSVTQPGEPVLAYGRSWRRGPFSCRSAAAALSCSSRAGHGFTLARAGWRVW